MEANLIAATKFRFNFVALTWRGRYCHEPDRATFFGFPDRRSSSSSPLDKTARPGGSTPPFRELACPSPPTPHKFSWSNRRTTCPDVLPAQRRRRSARPPEGVGEEPKSCP